MVDPIRANNELWDAWTAIHVDSAFYDVASFVDGTRPIRLAAYEREELGPVAGRSLLHLQCHFGLDTLSWARLGAIVTGADFSGAAIDAARALAERVGLPARFIRSDLDALPDVLEGRFDVVYTSRGVLGWLPDIRRWAAVAAHFVRPGGTFYITEIHPVADAFENAGVTPGELRLAYPYWDHPERPLRFDVSGSYADRDADTGPLVEHGWDHALGDIVTALIDAGLVIDSLREYDWCAWQLDYLVQSEDGRWRLPPGTAGQLPLFFSLRAHKPG
jgi:SAM-dependent methyltransferase